MSETAEQIYEAFKETGYARCAPHYFELYFGSWLRNPALKAEMLEPVRTIYLADKEAKRLAEYKHRHPEKPRQKRPFDCGVVLTKDPVDKGYLSANPVRALRAANGMGVDEFCAKVKVSDASLYKWERSGIPNDPMWRDRAVHLIGNVFNTDVSEACDQWVAENPHPWVPVFEKDKRPKAQKIFLEQKYRDIGHALIEAERIQRELRIQTSLAKRDFQKRLNRPGTPLDEMALWVAKLDRLHNREVIEEIKRVKLVEDRARTKRALDAIKRDEEIAAEWAEKHKDELAPFKQDWKLYFGVPLVGKPDDGANVRVPSEDYTQMRAVDSTGHLLLEDAILAKIQKEKEGYFVKLDYNGRSHAITLLNDDDYVPMAELAVVRPLDEVREARTDKRWLGRGTNGTLNKGNPLNNGMINGHNVGDAGRRFEAMMLEEQAEIARREAARREVRERVYEVRRYAADTPVPSASHVAPPMEIPAAPKVLPEGVAPMDLATLVPDSKGWKRIAKKSTRRGDPLKGLVGKRSQR